MDNLTANDLHRCLEAIMLYFDTESDHDKRRRLLGIIKMGETRAVLKDFFSKSKKVSNYFLDRTF